MSTILSRPEYVSKRSPMGMRVLVVWARQYIHGISSIMGIYTDETSMLNPAPDFHVLPLSRLFHQWSITWDSQEIASDVGADSTDSTDNTRVEIDWISDRGLIMVKSFNWQLRSSRMLKMYNFFSEYDKENKCFRCWFHCSILLTLWVL